MNVPAKPISLIVFSLFLVLLFGSLYFALERVMFCDASLIFTEILNTGGLRIQEKRYGSFITQLFPLLGGKMHLPLKAIVILYSASFNLFYLVVAGILLFRFRNYLLAVLMAFYYILFASDTYFWTNNEVHQAIAWLFLVTGMVLHYKKRHYAFILHLVLFALVAFLSLFTHPLIIFILPFLWLFILLEPDLNPYSRKEQFILSGILVLICVIKYYSMHHGGYDTDKIRSATHVSLKDIIGAFTSPMARIIIKKMISTYYFVPLLFITGAYFAYRQRKWKHIALVCFFAIGYFLAICLTFSDFITFYTESEWMPFAIITSALFVYYALPKLKPTWAVGLLSFIFIVRLGYIAAAAPKFTERRAWVNSVLDNMEQQGIYKGYVYQSEATERILIMSWGLPTESLIASSLRGDHPTRTFVTDNPEGIVKRTVPATQMIASFGPWDHTFLNPEYFTIDTLATYHKIEIK